MDEGSDIEVSRAGIGAGARILELGDGHAHFLGWATAGGCKVVGTEIHPALHEGASSAGYNVHLGTLE